MNPSSAGVDHAAMDGDAVMSGAAAIKRGEADNDVTCASDVTQTVP